MKIVIDLCVDSDGLMFKELAEKLKERDHEVIITARDKVQALDLYRYMGLEFFIVGKYAKTLEEKLLASAERIYNMAKIIKRELKGLDAIISNTGVEASRVGFGLGAQTHTFHDHPEAIHQLLLTLPISTYIYYPWTIPKSFYKKHGIKDSALVPYKGFLTASWMSKIKVDNNIIEKLGLDPDRRIIVFRESEMGAAYLFGKNAITLQAVKKLAETRKNIQFVARPRYHSAILEGYFKGLKNVTIFKHPIDLQSLLAKADMLIGGGATMNLEATYYGTPTIMCRQITSPITDYLAETGLAVQANSVVDIIKLTRSNMNKRKEKLAREIHDNMEFPLDTIIEKIEGIKK